MEYKILYTGKVEYVGINIPTSLSSQPKFQINLEVGLGIAGDRHFGLTRLVNVRDGSGLGRLGIIKKTPVLNTRQISFVSQEELSELAKKIGLRDIPLGSMGENVRVSGIPNLTQLSIGTFFGIRPPGKSDCGAVLMNTGENIPCRIIAEEVAKRVNLPVNSQFVRLAMGLRGLTGMAMKSGSIAEGDLIDVLSW